MQAQAVNRRFAHLLLQRAVTAGLADGFTLRQVAPCDASKMLKALERLIEVELIQRVPIKCGVWNYRLTPAGVLAAGAKDPPKLGCGGDQD